MLLAVTGKVIVASAVVVGPLGSEESLEAGGNEESDEGTSLVVGISLVAGISLVEGSSLVVSELGSLVGSEVGGTSEVSWSLADWLLTKTKSHPETNKDAARMRGNISFFFISFTTKSKLYHKWRAHIRKKTPNFLGVLRNFIP